MGLYALYMLQHEVTPLQISSALALSTFSQLICEIPAGTFADRVPYRTALFASQIMRLAAYLTFIIWPTFYGFLCGLVLIGIKETLISGTLEALLFEELGRANRESEYTECLGKSAAIDRAALLISGGLAAMLLPFGWNYVIVASLLMALAAAFNCLLLPSTQANKTSRKTTLSMVGASIKLVWQSPNLRWLVGFYGIVCAIELWDYWSLYAVEIGFSSSQASWLVAGVNAMGMLAGIATRWFTNLNMNKILVVSAMSGALILSAMWIWSPVGVPLALLGVGLFYLTGPLSAGGLQEGIPSELRATVTSIPALLSGITYCGVSLLFGTIAQAFGFQAAFMSVIVLYLGLVALFTSRLRPKHNALKTM